MGHSGQTPSFISNILLSTKQKQGVVFLANGGNINGNLVMNIKSVLDGDLQQQYAMSLSQQVDIILSAMIILLSIAVIVMLITGIRNTKRYKPQLTKKKIAGISLWTIVTIIMLFQLWNYPHTAGTGWTYALDWNPPSTTALFFVMPIFFTVTAWYTYTKKTKKSFKKLISESSK